MKFASAWILLGAMWLLALHLATGPRATAIHPVEMACTACHLAKGNIDESNAKTLVASQEALCSGCHQNALTASHPSGIRPRSALPEVFPLDWKGDLTCSTCHRVHQNDPGKLRVRRAGKALCQACHEAEFFARMKDGGSSIMRFGHLDARASMAGGIDNFSVQCMTCHETLGGNLRVRVNGQVMRHDNNRVNHPVGMRYADSVNYGGYRPEASLRRAILLPDGKVSCISCHRGYSEEHGGLVVDNRADQLCFSCHDM